MGRSYPGAQAVTRAVGLLKAFTDTHPEWRLADLARAAHLHRATAHRLLGALEREGMVARDTSGELYRLGPEAIALGARAVRATDLRTVSRARLEALSAETGETVTLEVPVGPDMLILDEVPGPALVGASASLGTRWPAHATSTGKAALATLSDAECRTILGPRLVRCTERTIVSFPALARELARVRRLGYATAIQELERGYVAVGAAVVGPDECVVAAISVGGPSLRFPATRLGGLGRQVRSAAVQISTALGHRGER